MTNFQKLVLVVLAVAALLILALMAGAAVFFLRADNSQAVSVSQAAGPISEQLVTATATAFPTVPASPTPTATKQPTPTGTRVVVITVLPSPTPTVANCINNITNFAASSLLTDEQVRDYIRQTLPPDHLDNCRAIKFVDTVAAAHATPISGNFVPVYREIFVYAIQSDQYGSDELMDTVIHEIGHNVHYNLRRNNYALDIVWDGLHKQSHKTFAGNGLGFISNYARANKYEDFAESYMAYVRFPELLKINNGEKYEFMRLEVFKGKEFIP